MADCLKSISFVTRQKLESCRRDVCFLWVQHFLKRFFVCVFLLSGFSINLQPFTTNAVL